MFYMQNHLLFSQDFSHFRLLTSSYSGNAPICRRLLFARHSESFGCTSLVVKLEAWVGKLFIWVSCRYRLLIHILLYLHIKQRFSPAFSSLAGISSKNPCRRKLKVLIKMEVLLFLLFAVSRISENNIWKHPEFTSLCIKMTFNDVS
jgi:hypothetical protein